MVTPNPRRSGNPATRAAAAHTPRPATPRQVAFHTRSRGLLVRLSRLPKLVIPALMLALMLTGLSAPLPVALVALGLAAAFVGWLAMLSWPVLDVRGKFVRGLMLGLIAGSAIARVNGWF